MTGIAAAADDYELDEEAPPQRKKKSSGGEGHVTTIIQQAKPNKGLRTWVNFCLYWAVGWLSIYLLGVGGWIFNEAIPMLIGDASADQIVLLIKAAVILPALSALLIKKYMINE